MTMVLLGPTQQPGLACFPLTDEALRATSRSISKSMHGANLTIALLNTGRFRNDVAVTGVNGLVHFGSATGEKFELNLELQTAMAPGAVVQQYYTVVGWDRLFATPYAEVTVTTCIQSMEFADGGAVIIN